MNIVNKVTIRHLKENKRRTLVTIIGVIISVAMITAVATLGVSFLDLMIRQHITSNGEWHVQYSDVTPDQIEAIEQHSETKKLVISSDGYAFFEETNNDNKPYIYIQSYNGPGMQQFPVEIIDGRLPYKPNEIVVSEEMLSQSKVDYKIGDELHLEIGERVDLEGMKLKQHHFLERDGETLHEELRNQESKEMVIVGVMKRPTWEVPWAPGYTVLGYVDEKLWSETSSIDAYVVVEDVNSSIYENAKSLAKEQGIETVNFNSDLLRYYGVTANDNLRQTLYSLAGIIMTVIIIGSVALIYNAFAISVSERSRHLGMLSSVGATKKQKRNSVFFEGTIIGAISIPIGIIAGLGGIGVTFIFINTFIQNALGISEKLELVVTPASILVACAISILTIFISTYIPAQRASKISAIDAIRQTQDIKLSGRTVKTSKIVRKIFGLEAEIGLKNVKRIKKRYLATVFSLVISIVLFLSVSYFTDGLKKSLEMSQDNIQFDIQLYGDTLEKNELKSFASMDHVTESFLVSEVLLDAFIDKDELPTELKMQIEEYDMTLEDGKYPYYVTLYSLDDENFQAYAEEVGVDTEKFTDPSQLTAIVIEQISYEDGTKGKIIETKSIESEVGNKIDVYLPSYNEIESEQNEPEFLTSVEIGALTDLVPVGVNTVMLGGINLIIPESSLKQLSISDERVSTYLYMNSSDPLATQAAIEERNEPNVHVYNVYQSRQREEQMILLLSIFTYGFITLISLISIANIFNTISTSISLRTREFAMLRSVGMTPKGFNKMIRYESMFYGMKALGYGLPISMLIMYGIHRSTNYTFEYAFRLPWMSIGFVIIAIFLIVGSAMLYSIAKIKKENIIEGLKQENI